MAASFSILKPKTVDHTDAETAERVSEMATPLPNGIIQTFRNLCHYAKTTA